MQKHQHNKTHYIKKEEEKKKKTEAEKKEGSQASALNISFSPNHTPYRKANTS